MPSWLHWTLPMPVVAEPGDKVPLKAIIGAAFPGMPNAGHHWLAYYDEGDLAARNWDFWDPGHADAARWLVNGKAIGGGFENQRYIGANIDSAVLDVGNAIGPVSFVTIPIAGSNGSFAEYIQYSVIVLDPAVMSASAGKRAPTAGEIVDAAYRLAKFYGSPVNDFDCHFIASAVGAAAGATLTDFSMSLDPDENEEHGFWRIVHRGSDKPVANWQTLVKPGDIVRMEWKNGGPHTTTVLAVNKSAGTMTVYDNTKSGRIGVHEVDFDQQTKPGSITIYRLTTDNLYLEQGTNIGEALPGTLFNDLVIGAGGADTLYGGARDDVLRGGSGNDRLDGGAGKHDIADFSDRSSKVVVTLKNGAATATVGSSEKDTLVGIEGVTGGKKADRLTGDTKANELDGGKGSDVLNGGGGKDTLTGGAGADKFVFSTKLGSSNVDTIVDFKHDSDVIALDDAIFSKIGPSLSKGEFYAKAGATKAHDGNDRIIYDKATGKLYYDDDGKGGHAAVLFAKLSGHPTLDAGDFAIV
jgi:Ca2+-binding RTX toxin-like protein